MYNFLFFLFIIFGYQFTVSMDQAFYLVNKTCNTIKTQLSKSLDSSAQEEDRTLIGSAIRYVKKQMGDSQMQRDILGLGNCPDRINTLKLIRILKLKIENGLPFDNKDLEQLLIRQEYATLLAIELNGRLIAFNNKPISTHTNQSISVAITDIYDSHTLRKIDGDLCLNNVLKNALTKTTKASRILIRNAILAGQHAEVKYLFWPNKSIEELKSNKEFLPDSDDEQEQNIK